MLAYLALLTLCALPLAAATNDDLAGPSSSRPQHMIYLKEWSKKLSQSVQACRNNSRQNCAQYLKAIKELELSPPFLEDLTRELHRPELAAFKRYVHSSRAIGAKRVGLTNNRNLGVGGHLLQQFQHNTNGCTRQHIEQWPKFISGGGFSDGFKQMLHSNFQIQLVNCFERYRKALVGSLELVGALDLDHIRQLLEGTMKSGNELGLFNRDQLVSNSLPYFLSRHFADILWDINKPVVTQDSYSELVNSHGKLKFLSDYNKVIGAPCKRLLYFVDGIRKQFKQFLNTSKSLNNMLKNETTLSEPAKLIKFCDSIVSIKDLSVLSLWQYADRMSKHAAKKAT